jgi:Uma2 family endonuclease
MATTSSITLDEFLRMRDDEKPSLEYACGEAIQKAMPNRAHWAIQIFLGSILVPFLARTGLGRAYTEFRCIFGPSGSERAYVPDLLYVAKERLTLDPFFRAAPDLVIEILSPGQDSVRFLDKIQFYLLNGVRLVWVVDPEAGTIGVLAPGEEAHTLTTGDTLDGGDVLPGFSIALDDIFESMGV